jgi:acetyl esterase/lipase
MKACFLLLYAAFAMATLNAQSNVWQPSPGHSQIPIWPGKAPDAQRVASHEAAIPVIKSPVAGKPWLEVVQVSQPTITVYSPARESNGTAVVVFPGGGYQILAIDLEGTEVCDWLISKGITCVVLKYRVPGEGLYPKSGAYPRSPMALEDAQRAVGLVRFHAAEWKIDPHKVGVLGFSAGGHLVGAISTNFKERLYAPVDQADKESCRPDFGVALYPGHMRENTSRPFQLNPYVPVTKETPPTFILQAENDPVDAVENSLVYFEALKEAGVPAEMHIYAEGGHAFGLRRTKYPITGWPELVEKWLGTIGMMSQ